MLPVSWSDRCLVAAALAAAAAGAEGSLGTTLQLQLAGWCWQSSGRVQSAGGKPSICRVVLANLSKHMPVTNEACVCGLIRVHMF